MAKNQSKKQEQEREQRDRVVGSLAEIAETIENRPAYHAKPDSFEGVLKDKADKGKRGVKVFITTEHYGEVDITIPQGDLQDLIPLVGKVIYVQREGKRSWTISDEPFTE